MNFSDPTPIKSDKPKINVVAGWLQKAWASLTMISLWVPGASTKDNIGAKNIGVIIFVLLVSYFIICGVWLNVQWLKGIHVSGEWFYYAGIPFLVFVCIEILNIDKKVREFCIEKKIMYPNRDSMLERIIGRSKAYNIISTLAEVLSFFWVIAGIIFYDRTVFIVLFCGAILLTSSASLFKKQQHARKIFIAENIFWIVMLIFIFANHFLNA